jgi:uridine kinase
MAPMLPDGKFDYESVEALNIAQVQNCLLDLMQLGYCDKPVFDFESRRPFDYKERIQLDDGDVAVVEGIHALNPIIYQALPPEGIIKAYISVDQRIQNKGKDVLTSREIRLLRRLVRDYRFRSTSAETTLSMWAGVCRGEDLYLTPYAMDCDVKINSVHIYEPCVIGKDALKLLKDVSNDSEHYQFAQQMISKISLFEFIDDVLVPHRSLLREFIGDGYYN